MTNNYYFAFVSVRIAENYLGISNYTEVLYKESVYFSEPNISSMFLQEGHYIVFNNSFLEKASMFEVMISGFHEARHAYQFFQVKFPNSNQLKFQEEESILKEWAKDFDNIKQPCAMSKEEYLNRFTEIDAIAFSCYLVYKLFNITQIIPDEIKEKVFFRICEIKKNEK